MTYVDGFVTPVPTANKEAYLAHAIEAADLFRKLGATRMVEAWGDDVPDGKLNDLKKAVQATPDETVLFSWIEYPDKATGLAAGEKMMNDPQAAEMMKDMPFDGSRMIFAGFDSIVEQGAPGGMGYLDGYVLPVPADNEDAYRAMAEKAAGIFREYGALRVVEAWSEDIPAGKVTDYNRATLREEGERVVYSWVEWPDKATRDAAWPKMMEDERMKPDGAMPFDGKRMMWGGFAPILDQKLA
ncbi:DUF1428 domain-containing protein [Sphingomonas psychrotolerans]|uniref:DUF1428 domain-containing protein n=2 Tax=Sphingomonas psychrotolerans TaxID=1327635 RepID=A0A2K8MHM7_9SPHN|nr:DUF1428 domain-containing protein [Sphingomonas psychrotolerans]